MKSVSEFFVSYFGSKLVDYLFWDHAVKFVEEHPRIKLCVPLAVLSYAMFCFSYIFDIQRHTEWLNAESRESQTVKPNVSSHLRKIIIEESWSCTEAAHSYGEAAQGIYVICIGTDNYHEFLQSTNVSGNLRAVSAVNVTK